jgi:pimeloyl-ACP methyl ester carboxylesterase
MLATKAPERVDGLVMIGPSLPIAPPVPERASIDANFYEPYPADVSGWGKYNLAYWHDHYEDFVRFFFSEMFSEPHSTKQFEDAVGWALETGPEILEAESKTSRLVPEEVFDGVSAPTLVIHGSDDRIVSHQVALEAARRTGGSLLTMGGSGHGPMARDPVKVNLAIREFVESLR